MTQAAPSMGNLPVVLSVSLPCLLSVLSGMKVVTPCYGSMVRRLFVIAGLGVLGGFAMVLGRVVVMLRRLLVMFVNVMVVHRRFPVVMARYGFEHRHGR